MPELEKTKKEFEDLWLYLKSLVERPLAPGENDFIKAARIHNVRRAIFKIIIIFACLWILRELSYWF